MTPREAQCSTKGELCSRPGVLTGFPYTIHVTSTDQGPPMDHATRTIHQHGSQVKTNCSSKTRTRRLSRERPTPPPVNLNSCEYFTDRFQRQHFADNASMFLPTLMKTMLQCSPPFYEFYCSDPVASSAVQLWATSEQDPGNGDISLSLNLRPGNLPGNIFSRALIP